MNRDRIEFYVGGVSKGLFAFVESSHAPGRGDKVNIRGETYTVRGRSYSLDQSERISERSMCCVVVLKKDSP